MTPTQSTRVHDRVRLDTTHDGTVAWLVMERGDGPANAFTAEMVEAMATAVADLPAGVSSLVLRGDREFSVGADLATIRETPAELRPATIDAIAGASNRFIRHLRAIDLPAIAAVNGTAAGGGLGFALACDVIVMHAEAILDPAYARVGLTPDNGTPFFLARALGPYRALELLLDPGPVDAETARSIGIVSRTVTGDATAFDRAVGAAAADLAARPSSVQAMTKSLVDAAFTDGLDDHLERERAAIRAAADSPVFSEGLDAFFEDREPDWQRPGDTEDG